MKYREFGTTGLEVSELVFGCGAVGGLLINADEDTRRKAIRMALDAGINWFDTASSYGQGRSEAALGRVACRSRGRAARVHQVPDRYHGLVGHRGPG